MISRDVACVAVHKVLSLGKLESTIIISKLIEEKVVLHGLYETGKTLVVACV